MSIPYVPQGTSKRFRVPRTLAADFDAFLDRDIPNTNMDFELIHNWYNRNKEGYEPVYIRGEIYPDSTKSRYENTDNNMNIRCSLTSGIRKGDMVVEPDSTIFILDWDGHKESNDIPSRAVRCNLYLNIKRFKAAEVDEEGYVINEDGYVVSGEKYDYGNEGQFQTIVEPIPCNAYRYDGRPEYVTVSGTPGGVVNALTLLTVQFNEQTKNIHVDDIFEWGDETYEIVDINRVGVDITGTFGTLKIQAKKQPGGLHGY
jgi:hypothetical protein